MIVQAVPTDIAKERIRCTPFSILVKKEATNTVDYVSLKS